MVVFIKTKENYKVPPLLQLQNVKKYFPVYKGITRSKVFGYIKAADDINLSINKGETFGLVGESGCGKTTISKMMLLLEKPTDGVIKYLGKDISSFSAQELAEYRSSVQAVFQDPSSSLNPKLRIEKIVTEPLLRKNGISKTSKKIRMQECLNQVGLDISSSRKFPHEFSGGQRQRIALARALIVRPKLIILDEPVSALDVSIQAQIMNLLKDLQNTQSFAFVFIAHNLATVRYMSDKIAVMYLGRIVETGPSESVFEKKYHPYTKALFSAALPPVPSHGFSEYTLQGEVPSAFNPPPGCRFKSRCQVKCAKCDTVEPILKKVDKNHFVSCHIY